MLREPNRGFGQPLTTSAHRIHLDSQLRPPPVQRRPKDQQGKQRLVRCRSSRLSPAE